MSYTYKDNTDEGLCVKKGEVKMKVEYKDNSEQVLSAMEKAIKNGLEAIGLTAEGHAKKITPVDTGRLRNSISHATDKEAAYIGTNVEYAAFV